MENFVAKGMICDVAVHDPDKGEGGIPNPHVHVLVPIRPVNTNGEWGEKRLHIPVFDEDGKLTNTVPSGDKCTLRMKVRFHSDIEEPIFAFTVKNKLGIELMGTNTMYENCGTGLCKAGEEYIISFTQNIHLHSGEYLLSFGCTGFGNDEVTVYHRLYDICNFLVISSKEAVGYFDPESDVLLEKMN